MKTSNLYLLLSLCAITTSVTANLAGTAMAVDIGVVNEVKNYAMPTVLKIMNDYKIGKIEFSEGNVDNFDLNFAIKDMNSI